MEPWTNEFRVLRGHLDRARRTLVAGNLSMALDRCVEQLQGRNITDGWEAARIHLATAEVRAVAASDPERVTLLFSCWCPPPQVEARFLAAVQRVERVSKSAQSRVNRRDTSLAIGLVEDCIEKLDAVAGEIAAKWARAGELVR